MEWRVSRMHPTGFEPVLACFTGSPMVTALVQKAHNHGLYYISLNKQSVFNLEQNNIYSIHGDYIDIA